MNLSESLTNPLTLYYIFAAVILGIQVLVMLEAYRHLIFTLRKYRPKKRVFTPSIALIIPCKGLDNTFERNIRSLFLQDYPDYEIFLVVESESDPAYQKIKQVILDHQTKKNTVHARHFPEFPPDLVVSL